MGKLGLVVHNLEHLSHFEVAKGSVFDGKLLKTLKLNIEKNCLQQDRRALICLPTNFEFRTNQYPVFFRFLHKHLADRVLFVPHKEFLPWSSGWQEIFKENFVITELDKSEEWARQQVTTAECQATNIGDTIYLKCRGALHQDVDKWRTSVDQALAKCQLPGKLLKNPLPISSNGGTCWSALKGGFIIDVGEIFCLDRNLLSVMKEHLESHHLSPASEGIYFITSGFLQNWMLAQMMPAANFHYGGNIVRVLPENQPLSQTFEKEAFAIAQSSQEQPASPLLFTHQVAGAGNAAKAIRQFFPDIIITDEISAAGYLQSNLPAMFRHRTYHVTPAADPRVRIVSSQIITQGYDVKLFAEYLVSRYQNNRERPNDTCIYYFDAQPDSLKKVISLLLVDFAHILSEQHNKLLQSMLQCETQASEQGSFVISLLDEKMLDLKINLPFTASGGGQFMAHYGEFFPDHFSVLCEPLRLLLKGDTGSKTILGRLHVIQDFTEFVVQNASVRLESRLQPQQTSLTFQASQQEGVERQSLALISLLNGSDVFNRLADKEVLIELISLLWDNSKKSHREQEQSQFLITLHASMQNTELKVLQGIHNKISLKQVQQQDNCELQLIGDTTHSPDAQKRLLKIISMFFMQSPQDPSENAWKFAVFEALSNVSARVIGDQVVSFDFKIVGTEKSAVLVSHAGDKVEISARSRKTMETGAERVIVSANGRQITLVKNPSSKEAEVPAEAPTALQKELESLQHTKVMQEMENTKAKEAVVRNEKLRAIYDQALESYNKKFGDTPDQESEPPTRKTLEQAAQTKVVRATSLKSKEMAGRISRVLWPVVLVLVVIGSGVTWYLFHKKIPPAKSGLLLEEANDRPRQQAAPVVATAPKQENLPVDPGAELVKEVMHSFTAQEPSQDQLNEVLRKLHLQKERLTNSGDFHNLIGRMFWYKIYLDRNTKMFSKAWVIRWRDEAAKAWETARRQYENKQRPALQMALLPWMPEKTLSTGKEESVVIIQYKSAQQAIADIDRLLQEGVTEIDRLVQNW